MVNIAIEVGGSYVCRLRSRTWLRDENNTEVALQRLGTNEEVSGER